MTVRMPGRLISVAMALPFAAAPMAATAGDVFVGQWGGMVPVSIEFLSDTSLRMCREDLRLQCNGPIPYHREGESVVVEHRSDGLKWTFTPRLDGGYDAVYARWNGKDGYDTLVSAVLQAR